MINPPLRNEFLNDFVSPTQTGGVNSKVEKDCRQSTSLFAPRRSKWAPPSLCLTKPFANAGAIGHHQDVTSPARSLSGSRENSNHCFQLEPEDRSTVSRCSWKIPNLSFGFPYVAQRASLVAQMVKKLPAMQEMRVQSIPGSRRSPGESSDHLLQYSCLENPMDRGSWWAMVCGVTESRTRLSDWH